MGAPVIPRSTAARQHPIRVGNGGTQVSITWCSLSMGLEGHTLILSPSPSQYPCRWLPRRWDSSSHQATLLESIHQAGGINKAKLCNVKEHKLENKKQKEEEPGEAPLLLQPGPQVEAPSVPYRCPLQMGHSRGLVGSPDTLALGPCVGLCGQFSQLRLHQSGFTPPGGLLKGLRAMGPPP